MKNLISAARTVIVLGAIAAAAAGCKQTTATAPVDTAATTPVTTTADTAAKPKHKGAMNGNHSTAGDTAIGSSHTGMTGAGSGDGDKNARPAVRNNTGETQGTTPGTSLPVSDGSR
ncbi:hypothetical protein Q4S45_06540 [Massilia sp. R2A-15]|uniref:hypothetical protein n=1 Tax=Massilia sp. R2A-15 TaxID=3064278 RepID=UPI0027337F85|nr:hypothetical protein [Massilia sp. R2A-15]WLI90769.1 hypothetical protein Q4S45_06540 [Massilia sp. R2A-15]